MVPWAGLGATAALVPLLAAAGVAALTRTGRFTRGAPRGAPARHTPTREPLTGG